jgi:hypothetical protein
MPRIIEHLYSPREIFKNFHARKQRWSIMVCHRRAGKTVAKINDTINRILYFEPPTVVHSVDEQRPSADPGRFAYVAPYLNQARQIAWDYLKRYTQGMLKKPPSEAELSVTFYNDCKYTLYGADNPDAFRGQYFDGVDLDEYGQMKPSVWSEVILPTLIDRRGWATFIGTPNGPNHFADLMRHAQKDPSRWYTEVWPVSKTFLIPQEELDEMKRIMLPEEYEQEMECSFDAATRGAFYAREVPHANIGPFPADPDLPLHFVFDVGRRDDTALGAFQEYPDRVNIVHAMSESMTGTSYWLAKIEEICALHECTRGTVWLPHDAKAKTWSTHRSGVEQFLDAGIRPNIVPNLDKLDGINAARFVFKYITFNTPNTDELILALKAYHRTWDEGKKAFTNEDVHDWSSHYADMFRYLALVARFPHSRPLTKSGSGISLGKKTFEHYPFSLNDLWEQARGRTDRIQ